MSKTLYALLGFGLFAACSPASTSTKGQLITCNTDPGTGVILRCAPAGDGSGSGSGTCVDVDEDGDGSPNDTIASRESDADHSTADDDDGDGIPNEEDCDSHPGGDDGGDNGVDLPYDVKPQLGATATPIHDAFAENGAQPASIVSVTMDGGGTWRLAELQAGTAFVVTQDDCTHPGNRDVGRDRVIVTWKTTDGASHSDHLDIRYCGQ
jgi:hypothetical protein